jgi:hypothetical protein
MVVAAIAIANGRRGRPALRSGGRDRTDVELRVTARGCHPLAS